MHEVVDGVQQLLLLALKGGVVGGDEEQLALQLPDDRRLALDHGLELLLVLLHQLQLHLSLLLHLAHALLQEAEEEEEEMLTLWLRRGSKICCVQGRFFSNAEYVYPLGCF